MFRRCFSGISGVFRRVIPHCGLESCLRYGSCYTRVMILDRAKLTEVLGVEVPCGVRGVTHDSRGVEPGFAFVAVPGFKRDGTEFVPEAVRRGASLVVAERDVPGVPTAVVGDARSSLAVLAREVNGDPSRGMRVYGVTGTNGKTTTSYVLHAILACAHGEGGCGLMTTAETVSGGDRRPAVRTTPEATEVQGTLAAMLGEGVRRVVMEVSSHGISLKRVAGMRFAGAIFTNLSRDHLDLHGSMEAYYAAKRGLLHMTEGPRLANADDAYGRRLAGELEGVSTFGSAADADYRVAEVETTPEGTGFDLHHPGGVVELQTPLLGPYNVLNVAGAASLALAIGTDEGALVRAVRGMGQVPGRFERVASEVGFEVIVDYAHTDVGLDAVLGVARDLAEAGGGRVICVFGAAGERDGAKRPKMGRVGSRLADLCIITTDDAYSEAPEKIAREIEAGSDPSRTCIELDRRRAILRALEAARAGDVVVVAGKGHETVQHLPEGDIPFHDATVVGELLAKIGRKGR